MNGDERFQQYMAQREQLRQWEAMQKLSEANGNAAARSSSSALKFAPGQSVIYTPDPTVNGPWTHTDASIPLFKALPPPPKTPVPGGKEYSGMPGNRIGPEVKRTPLRPSPGGMYQPARRGGGMYQPAPRTAAPRAPSPVPTGLRDTNWTQTTTSALSPTRRRRTYRDVLADILSGEQ